ncbi:MAG: hypothetical protein JWQ03_1628 [Variovorax sp.]|nr:hypothetical protein [Variovorax sp.]
MATIAKGSSTGVMAALRQLEAGSARKTKPVEPPAAPAQKKAAKKAGAKKVAKKKAAKK